MLYPTELRAHFCEIEQLAGQNLVRINCLNVLCPFMDHSVKHSIR